MADSKVPFDVAVTALQRLDFSEMFSSIHSMFTNISKMNADQLVAAYQVMEISAAVQQDLLKNELFLKVKKALLTQMIYVASQDFFSQAILLNRFNLVTGGLLVEKKR